MSGNNDVAERDALRAAIDRRGLCLADPPLEFARQGRRRIFVHDPPEFAGDLDLSTPTPGPLKFRRVSATPAPASAGALHSGSDPRPTESS